MVMRAEDPHPFLPHVTAEHIVGAALEIIGNGPVSNLTVEDVLLKSETSASSIYHHFGNRKGLMAAVEQERYRRLAMAEERAHLDVGDAAQTSDEFLKFISDQLIRIVTEPTAAEARRQRLRVAVAALDDDDVFNRMSAIQTEMFKVIGKILTDGQRRGLVNPEINPIAYCAWFHGMTLGSTVTERSFPDVDAWLEIAIPAALAPLRLPQPGTQVDGAQ